MVSKSTLSELKNAYKSWNTSKGATAHPWFDLMADELSWRSIAGGAHDMEFTRPHSTKHEVQQYFEELAEDWQMVFYHVRTFLVEGNTVATVGECCWRHKTTKKIVHSPKLDIMRFKDEKIADFFEYFDNDQAILAASGNVALTELSPPEPVYPESGGLMIQGISSASRSNVQRLRPLYENWDRTKGQSHADFLNILAPEISWGSLANGAESVAFTDRKMSQQEVAAYFQGLAEAFEMIFYKAIEFIVAGNYVLMLGRCSFAHKATAKAFETPKADLWCFSNGKVIEFFEYYDTAAVLATTH